MRKRKSVIAILLAVMMILSFMPTMALAESVEGTVANATFTVKSKDLTPATANFYLDSTDSAFKSYKRSEDTVLTGCYDGATHTVVADAVPGYTISYEVYNSSTDEYEAAASGVTIKDVQDKDVEVKATFTKISDSSKEYRTFYVNLIPAIVHFSFDADASKSDTKGEYVYYVDGSKYNTADYIAFTPDQINIKDVPAEYTDQAGAYIKAYNAANKAALAANLDEINDVFNDLFEVTAAPDQGDPDKITLKIDEKDMTAKDKAALRKKHEQLLTNFEHTLGDWDADEKEYVLPTATLYINSVLDPASPILAEYVRFTNSPKAKSYKVKALKKKSKSFTVKAEADNGAAVNYKLINAPAKIIIDKTSGKITLKKGLAKGIYRIKLKAYVKGNSKVYKTHAITIRVRKK